MPRNMSFALTTRQIRDRTKTVTRRLRWFHLKEGDEVRAVVKSQGLKKGESVQVLAMLRIISVRDEPLSRCTDADAAKEGFPNMSGQEFIAMFCREMKCKPSQQVRRIEFEYV